MTIKENNEKTAMADRLRVKACLTAITDDKDRIITYESYADEAEIIKVIRENFTDKIDEKIYYFPHGTYLFITDKGYPFNIRQTNRPLTDEEREDINNMRYALRLRKDYLFTDEDKEIYKRDKKEYAKKIKDIYTRAEREGDFIIRPLKKNKQIRIFISGYHNNKFTDLGYNIIEQEREIKDYKWNEEKLSYLPDEDIRLSYSFNMNFKAFMSACISGEIPKKGYIINESGESEKITHSGQSEKISVKDGDGNIREFASKAEAARELGVSASLISKKIKGMTEGEEVTVIKGNMKNRKGIKLITADGERLEFESVRSAAVKLGIDKSKLSRLLKDKESGQSVTILGLSYTIS